jgi:hypothetical protein
MSSHLQTAAEAKAKAEAKLLHQKLLHNVQWVLDKKKDLKEKGSENTEEYDIQCAYIGRMAAERLALQNPQDVLVERLTKYGFIKLNVCKSKNLLPLIQLMLDELSPILDEKDNEKTAITLCYSQVEVCPLPTPKVLQNKAPIYFSFMESLHCSGCKSLFPDLPELSSQCLRTVAGVMVPSISQSVHGAAHLSPYDQGAIHETQRLRKFIDVKQELENGFTLLPPHLDYDQTQVDTIKKEYKDKPTKQPTFIVMPLERPVSILVYGNGREPKLNETQTAYLGELQRIDVGEMLICAWNLWHCTGPPNPLARHQSHHGKGLTYLDTRIHASFGFTREDIDQANLQLPEREPFWKTVFKCSIGCDTRQYASQASMFIHMEQVNKRKRRRNEKDFMFLRTPKTPKDDQDLVAHE